MVNKAEMRMLINLQHSIYLSHGIIFKNQNSGIFFEDLIIERNRIFDELMWNLAEFVVLGSALIRKHTRCSIAISNNLFLPQLKKHEQVLLFLLNKHLDPDRYEKMKKILES